MAILVEYNVTSVGRPTAPRFAVERKVPHQANVVVAVYRQERVAEDVAAKLNQWVGSEEL